MPQQQQSFGGFGGYGMPQQRGFGGFGGGYGMPQQQMGGFNQMPRQQQESGGYGIPQQQQGGYNQMNRTPSLNLDAIRQSGLGDEFGASQAAAQAAALQSMGMPQSEGGMDAGMGAYNQASAARNMAERERFNAAQTQANPANLANAYQDMLRGMGGAGSGSQSAAPQPMVMPQPMMPPNPYSQQMRQEDPRMQAMRYMQRMNFGGGGGYNF